jgi:site-specific recombinase XerD
MAYVNEGSRNLSTALAPVVLPTLHPAPERRLARDRHPAFVYLARLAPGSRRTMAQALSVVAALFGHTPETLDWAALRYQHTQAIRAKLAESRAPAGVNKILAAIRGVLREAWRLGLMDAETYERGADIRSVCGEQLPRGRALGKRELQKLFVACAKDVTAAGRRDAALIAILYGGGLRRSELVALDLVDYRPETAELRIRHGKGQKARVGYATNGAKLALDAWLAVRGSEPGPLFWPAEGRGRPLVNRRMTDQAVLMLLRRRAAQARVAAFTPHDLRRTFIGDLLDHGADMVTVQKLAGHSNVQTTARYDRRGAKTKRRAAELLHVPFVS